MLNSPPDQMSYSSMDELPAVVVAEGLPLGIQGQLDRIIVARRGGHPDAYMVTEAVTGVAEPNRRYRVVPEGLEEVQGASAQSVPGRSVHPTPPTHLRLEGRWECPRHRAAANKFSEGKKAHEPLCTSIEGNILGENGTLSIASEEVVIPHIEATQESLAYYGAHLFAVGDTLSFEGDEALPITTVGCGPRYVTDYLLREDRGGGAYIEFHDRPHFHMPIGTGTSGALILGHFVPGGCILTGFLIPEGYAIYTPGGVLHSDAFLIGRFCVVYSVTESFSTVIFRGPSKQAATVMLGPLER